MKALLFNFVFLVFVTIFAIVDGIAQTKTEEITKQTYFDTVNASIKATSQIFPRRIEFRMDSDKNGTSTESRLISEYFAEDNWTQTLKVFEDRRSQTFELRHVGKIDYCRFNDGDWTTSQCKPKYLIVDAPMSDKVQYENEKIPYGTIVLNIFAQYRTYSDTVEGKKIGTTPSHFFRDKIWINDAGSTRHREIFYQLTDSSDRTIELQSVTETYTYGISSSLVEPPIRGGRER